MKQEIQELYRKYLDNELTESGRSAFENRLTTDTEFKNDFILFKEMEGFLQTKTKHGDALSILKDVGSEMKGAKTKSGRKKVNWWILAIVLVAMVVAWGAYQKLKIEKKVPYAELITEPIWAIEKSGNNNRISNALSQYLSGNMLAATDTLKKIDSEESLYWLSEIYAKEILPDSALKYLPTPPSDKIRRDRINYLKIISLYESGDIEEAKRLYHEVRSDMDEYYLLLLSPLK
jgi:hypothetical protein